MDVTERLEVFSALKLPEQDITLLPFCGGNKPPQVTQWVGSLKSLQTTATASQLYQAIPQVARLKASSQERKSMLDAIFCVAYPCALTLSKTFLNQPVDLPDAAQKTALVSQSILNSLTMGYLVCLRDICRERKLKPIHLKAIAEILFHGLQLQGLMQLRNLQLYSQASPVIWRQVNAMALIGHRFEQLRRPIKPLLPDQAMGTPFDMYCRIVAMATAKTNQLSQVDIGHVYNALSQWTPRIKIVDESATAWVDLANQRPPALTARQAMPEGSSIMSLDFSQLTPFLSNSIEADATSGTSTAAALVIPPEISAFTLSHLATAWSDPSHRGSGRSGETSELKIVIGFTACHQILSGIKTLSDFTSGKSQPTETAGGMPALSSLLGSLSLDGNDGNGKSSDRIATPLPATLLNSSASGYGITIEGAPSVKVDAGEVILVEGEGKHAWNLGLIRWIRRGKKQVNFGVLKLCDSPEAIAASGNYEQGGYSDPMRAFLLAHLLSPGRAGILTGNVLFKERTKVKIYRASEKKPESSVLGEAAIQTSKVTAFHLASALKTIEAQTKKHSL